MKNHKLVREAQYNGASKIRHLLKVDGIYRQIYCNKDDWAVFLEYCNLNKLTQEQAIKKLIKDYRHNLETLPLSISHLFRLLIKFEENLKILK